MKATLLLILWILAGAPRFPPAKPPCIFNHPIVVRLDAVTETLSLCVEESGAYRLHFKQASSANMQIHALFDLPETPILLGALRQSIGDPVFQKLGLDAEWEGQHLHRQVLDNEVQSDRYALSGGLELVTLRDLRSGRLLGCSIYREQNWLQRKLILEYQNEASTAHLESAMLSVIEPLPGQWARGVYHFHFD